MTDTFIITVDEVQYEVRDLPIAGDGGIFEIWRRGELQFIVHHVIKENNTADWEAGPEENRSVSAAFIRKIGSAIERYYD